MFSLFKKHEEKVVVVFDIGNGSIAGSLVKISSTEAPIILYSCREPLTYMHQATSHRLLANMLKLLKHVSGRIHKEGIPVMRSLVGHGTLHDAYCIFSSPWYVSQTRVIKASRAQQFIVSENVLNKLVLKEDQDFEQALKEGKYEKTFGADIKLLERKIIRAKLNGYEVHDPVGKKATELEVTFFSSFISQKILTQVEDALRHIFHFTSVHCASYALASWSTALDIFPNTHDFMFIDITNEVTDITVSTQGVLAETVSFPGGRAAVLRKIVDKLIIPPEVALSFMTMRAKGTLEKQFADKIDTLIAESADAWKLSLVKSLNEIRKKHVLPHKIYVTVDVDVAPYFNKVLAQDVSQALSTAHEKINFDVSVLNSNLVRQYITQQSNVEQDPFIMIDSIFINKLHV